MAKNEPYRAVLYAFMKKNERMSKKDVIEANSNLPVHQRTLYRWYDLIEQTNSISRKINPDPTKKSRPKVPFKVFEKKFNQQSLTHSNVIRHT